MFITCILFTFCQRLRAYKLILTAARGRGLMTTNNTVQFSQLCGFRVPGATPRDNNLTHPLLKYSKLDNTPPK